MTKNIIKVLLVVLPLLTSFVQPILAEAPIRPKTIDEMISYYAQMYSVDESVMHKIVKCESGYNPNAKNITQKEKSYGLSQINLLAHKHITIEEATNPDFALDFLASNLAKGNGKIWTCYK